MDSLAACASTSPDRRLLDAIRAWETEPKGMTLLEYTGLRVAEFAALCRYEVPVVELLARRNERTQLVAELERVGSRVGTSQRSR